MVVQTERKRRQELGQFFTPVEVVKFMFDMVWPLLKGRRKPRVIDPACGDGQFLLEAVGRFKASKRKFEPSQIVGCDIDRRIESQWVENGLHLEGQMHPGQNGLYGEDKTGSRAHLIEDSSFDLAIGNPPFGGVGVQHLAELAKLLALKKEPEAAGPKVVQTNLFEVARTLKVPASGSKEQVIREEKESLGKDADLDDLRLLSRVLKHKYQVWQRNSGLHGSAREPLLLSSALHNNAKLQGDSIIIRVGGVEFKAFDLLTEKEVRRLSSFPIEVLFVERFLQLAKAGGYVAIIVPDGILANATMQHVRDFIAQRARVLAIVSLPRGTFKGMGTNAKTSVLVLEKSQGDANESLERVYRRPVFLAVANYQPGLGEELEFIGSEFRLFTESGSL